MLFNVNFDEVSTPFSFACGIHNVVIRKFEYATPENRTPKVLMYVSPETKKDEVDLKTSSEAFTFYFSDKSAKYDFQKLIMIGNAIDSEKLGKEFFEKINSESKTIEELVEKLNALANGTVFKLKISGEEKEYNGNVSIRNILGWGTIAESLTENNLTFSDKDIKKIEKIAGDIDSIFG